MVRGGIPIPFMKINAASGPRLRFNLGRSILAKPPNRKRALEYLAASGAVPNSVIERDGMCSTIRAGRDGLSAQWWLDRQKAVPIARAARRFAGANPDLQRPRRQAASWARSRSFPQGRCEAGPTADRTRLVHRGSLQALGDQAAGQVRARAGLDVSDLSEPICPVLDGNRKSSTKGQTVANDPFRTFLAN